jgi:hypothetical protein
MDHCGGSLNIQIIFAGFIADLVENHLVSNTTQRFSTSCLRCFRNQTKDVWKIVDDNSNSSNSRVMELVHKFKHDNPVKDLAVTFPKYDYLVELFQITGNGELFGQKQTSDWIWSSPFSPFPNMLLKYGEIYRFYLIDVLHICHGVIMTIVGYFENIYTDEAFVSFFFFYFFLFLIYLLLIFLL